MSWRRGGAVALALVFILAMAALVLDAGGAPDLEPVVQRLEERGRPPLDVVVQAGRAAEVVLLSDVHGLPGPKRLAAEAVRALAEGPGLDAVVLAVPSGEQPYIDAYLTAGQEDATLLLNRPGAVREAFGASREFLEIYRAVWQANAELGAARQIRVIAADHPDWPPPQGASSTEAAALFAGRTEHMLQRMDEELLARIPDARLLVFVDGYMTLQRTHGEVRFAGGDPVRVDWLGETMRQRAGGAGVRTVLVDAGSGASTGHALPSYHGTSFHRSLRRELNGDVAVRTSNHFAVLADPILEASSPSVRLDILPDGVTMRDLADAYVFMESGR
ncbi:MAG TPA: hypothetical protein VK966_00800 [Longimicrobiales bacterium]|nr:hypothetical protein [Longimicrobiales bacterium]